MRVLLALITVGVTTYAFVDCLRSTDDEVRNLPRPMWLAVTLVPLVGGLAWLAFGRAPSGSSAPPPARQAAPDDDPDFLRSLDSSFRRQRREAAEEARRRGSQAAEAPPPDRDLPRGARSSSSSQPGNGNGKAGNGKAGAGGSRPDPETGPDGDDHPS